MIFFMNLNLKISHNNFKIYYYKENKKNIMKSLQASKRFKAIFGIAMIAIGIGAISKKIISYPVEGCMKGSQELTFKKELKYFI